MFQKFNKNEDIKLILASQSPRRENLLNMIGLDFTVQPSNIVEVNHDELEPLDYAIMNARNKAEYVADNNPDALVISADTIVVLGNNILEKPEDKNHAFEILSKLNGKTHEVITAFGIIIKDRNVSEFDFEKTQVKFRKVNSDNLKEYIETGESLDKAGGYGAQGLGSLLIERVNGCFYNVVGFPLSKFYIMYEKILNELSKN